MTTLTTEINIANAVNLSVSEDSLTVELEDGRTVSVPVAWYPRILHAKQTERNNFRMIGHGDGFHWPDLDEDISVQNMLAGKPSGESQNSFRNWLKQRGKVTH